MSGWTPACTMHASWPNLKKKCQKIKSRKEGRTMQCNAMQVLEESRELFMFSLHTHVNAMAQKHPFTKSKKFSLSTMTPTSAPQKGWFHIKDYLEAIAENVDRRRFGPVDLLIHALRLLKL